MGLLPNEGAHLVGILLGQITYGIYIYVVGRVFAYLKRRRAHRVITIFMILTCIVTTATQGIRIWTTYDAFVSRRNPHGARWFYQKEYKKVYALAFKCGAYINGAFADSLLCWRVYVVWNRNKRMLIIPLCFLFALIGSMTMAWIYQVGNTSSTQKYSDKEYRWLLATIFLTLLLNTIFSTLICLKIWRIVHSVSAQSAGSSRLYWRIIYAMAESGAIYAVLLCTYFIVTATNVDHAEVIISYIGPPVIGITPALVFLRLFSRPESMTRTTNHQSDSLASAAPSETVDVESNSIPMTVFASRR